MRRHWLIIGFFAAVLPCATLRAAESISLILYPSIAMTSDNAITDNATASQVQTQPRQTDGITTIPLTRLARVVADRAIRQQLADVSVDIPLADNANSVAKSSIKAALQANSTLQQHGFKVLGPERIIVRGKTSSATMEKLIVEAKRALYQAIEEKWPQRYRDVEFTYAANKKPMQRAGEQGTWHIDVSHLARLSQRVVVWAESRDAHTGKTSRRQPLWFKVKGEQWVLTARQAMSAKTELAEDRTAMQWRSLSSSEGETLSHTSRDKPSTQYRLLHAVKAGDVINAKTVERIPAVDFGQYVSVISKVGAIEIRSKAKALKKAYVNDVIPLQSLSSENMFNARVIKHGEVLISDTLVLKTPFTVSDLNDFTNK